MTAYRHREEALNTQLAVLLSRFGVKADAETIQASGRERPDVLFHWRGLRVVVVGKLAPMTNRQPVARTVALRSSLPQPTRTPRREARVLLMAT